jgi:hypothetical protein
MGTGQLGVDQFTLFKNHGRCWGSPLRSLRKAHRLCVLSGERFLQWILTFATQGNLFRQQGMIRMINLSTSTTIYRPVKQVFDFVSRFENDFEWQYGTVVTAGLPQMIGAVGTFFRSIGHLMGHRVIGTFEVTDYEPNVKSGFKSLSGPLQSQTSYTFEASGTSTKINISMQANVVNFFQMDTGILEKKMKKQLKENLAMLKNILEEKRILVYSATYSLAAES